MAVMIINHCGLSEEAGVTVSRHLVSDLDRDTVMPLTSLDTSPV
jgi:hypothetical protein